MTDNHKIVKAEVVAIDKKSMHPLVDAAMSREGELSLEKLEKLMDLQERHEKREAEKSYNESMVQLKSDLPRFIEQDKQVGYNGKDGWVGYTHTSLAKAVEEIVPSLNQYGFSHSWRVSNDDKKVRVSCRVMHIDGHCEDVTLECPPDLSGKKSPSQAIASTITRLERYTFLAILGVATREMEELDPRHTPDDTIDAVDIERNLIAIGVLKREGIELSDAEVHLNRDFKKWTSADLSELRSFIRSHREQRETDAK